MARNLTPLIFALGTALGMLFSPVGPIGSMLYPANPDSPMHPEGVQKIVLALGVVAQAMGVGVALVLLSRASRVLAGMERLTNGRRALSVATFVGLVWALVSWIPHIATHQHMALDDVWGLAFAEWAFHATVIGSLALVVRFVYVATDTCVAMRWGQEDARASAPSA